MKSLILLCSLIFAAHAWGNLHLAPPDFDIKEGRAVFIDMTEAHHNIVFDAGRRSTTATSEIKFFNTKEGMPIFDLIPYPVSVEIDGEAVEQKQISLPGGVSTVRVALKTLAPGEHTLKIVNHIKKHVMYTPIFRNVSAAFWIRDLKDRLFWEQYLPVNLEFDQHPRTMDVEFKGRKVHKQVIHANGKVNQTGVNKWRIEYPAWYTVSAAYFHTMRVGAKRTRYFTLKSVDGRNIPAAVYTFFPWSVGKFVAEAQRVFAELEADYGPWAHDKYIAYGSGFGGMEHAGATMTSFKALDHEMLHSYFAKCVLPANGNAGWIDEAIASWRDYGYQRSATPGVPANLAGRSVYARNTNNQAYEHGREFLAHLDYLMQDQGGLKAFLRGYFQTYKYSMITTEHFKNNLEFFSGLELDQMFQDNVFTETPPTPQDEEENAYHPELTTRELESLI